MISIFQVKKRAVSEDDIICITPEMYAQDAASGGLSMDDDLAANDQDAEDTAHREGLSLIPQHFLMQGQCHFYLKEFMY